MKQITLATQIETNGIGLHTGVKVNLVLKPAPPNTGYVFLRSDLDDFEIPANVEYVSHCSYATTLMRKGVMLSTVEHLLAALRGLGIDNAFIAVDNIEMPIMDGSSNEFIKLINQAGLTEQNAPRKFLQIRERIEIEQEGNRWMRIEPSDKYEIDCSIDFPHPLIKTQNYKFILAEKFAESSFVQEISAARTFGFTKEIEMLRKANLALGGSLENAIVLTADGMLNDVPLRFEDEFVRHKVLDIVGDLALLGMPFLGKVSAMRSGHSTHTALMSKLLKTRSAWEIVEELQYPKSNIQSLKFEASNFES